MSDRKQTDAPTTPWGRYATDSGGPVKQFDGELTLSTAAKDNHLMVVGIVGQGSDTREPTEEREMNGPSREEYDAKLEAVEARLETRLATIEGKMERFAATIDGKLDRLSDQMTNVASAASRAETAADAAKTSASNVKWNVLFISLTTAALVLGSIALWLQGIEMVTGLFGAASMQAPQ